MNAHESCTLTNPYGENAECAKFVIDDITSPFVLSNIATVGQSYMFSVWLMSEAEGNLIVAGTAFSSSASWTKHEVHFTASSVDLQLRFAATGTYYLYHPQLEIGTKATDWTPAPEDSDAKFSEYSNSLDALNKDIYDKVEAVFAQIEILEGQINTLVVDENGKSMMTQSGSGWVFQIGDLQNTVENTSSALSDLTTAVGDVDTTVGLLEKAVSDLEGKTEYISIGLYEDEPCIELGEIDSVFKLKITNTRIMFMDGDGVPTYIDTNGLATENIRIENELQHVVDVYYEPILAQITGRYIWKTRNNGNLGLTWIND